jgi:outer membrane murein-binding lipoprotein Lpp
VKGCLILVVFVILLGLSFVAGYYFAQKHEYFSTHHEPLPTSHATVEEENAVRERWDAFEKAARANESARIELSADDLNALIASEPRLSGNAYVAIDESTAHLQISMPLGKGRWFRGRYVNAQCSVRSGSNGKPQDVRITSITVNGRPVGEEVLEWKYGRMPSFRSYVADWITQSNLKTLEVAEGKVILETKAGNEDPFASESPAPSPALSLTLSPTPTP